MTKWKEILATEIMQAQRYDSLGDVVLRDQKIRNIEEIPLPLKYIRAALEEAGLFF